MTYMRETKKKLAGLAFCLAITLMVSCFSLTTAHADNKSVYLSDLLIEQPNRILAYDGWEILKNSDGVPVPGLNTDCVGDPIKLKGKYYAKGIGTHSSEDAEQLSYLEIDIKELGYEYFTALVGMADQSFSQEVERNMAGFIVEVDGVVEQQTDILTYLSDPVEISVSIKNASTLVLRLDPGVTRFSDLAIWANAKLSNESAVDKTTASAPAATPTIAPTPGPTAPPIEENMMYLSDYLKNDLSKMLEYTGYEEIQEGGVYVPGFDTQYDGTGIKIDGVPYAKGIGMHSNDSLDKETVLSINIKDSGYTLFTATIGMNDYEWQQEVERNVAKFSVMVDDETVYTSDVMKFDSKPQDISINIAGASELKLVIEPNETTYSDSALWGNALLIKDASVTPAPSSATPEATSKPTTKPTATAKATPVAKPSAKPSGGGDSGLSTPALIAIIAAGVVVVGGVVFIVIYLRKKKQNTPPSDDSENHTNS